MVRLESKHANSIILKFPVKNVIPVALGWGKKKKKKKRKKEGKTLLSNQIQSRF